jgi:hypothetical protein
MLHADATYFLAQALGFRSDVAYWIAAYNEVADLNRYAPIDQSKRPPKMCVTPSSANRVP